MIITFSIGYNTVWGEELFVTGSSSALGNNDIQKALPLSYAGDGIWQGSIRCNPAEEGPVSYSYFVKGPSGIHHEAGKRRSIAPGSSTVSIIADDSWQGNSAEAPFLSAPFADVFFADNSCPHTVTHLYDNELILRVTVPNIPKGGEVMVCGAPAELGEWNPNKALPMMRMENLKWEKGFTASRKSGKVWEFKFIIKTSEGEFIWEEGENRSLTIPRIPKHTTVIKEYSGAAFPATRPRYSGVAVPVFSLRSSTSHGIGDLADLKKLAGWAGRNGLSMIQLLPINDTTAYLTWRDSYPYNCVSTQALHPIYINLEAVGKLKEKSLMAQMEEEGKSLNCGEFLDYEAVWNSKMKWLKAIYAQEKEKSFAEPGCRTFMESNREWLLPYAAFSALRDRHGSADFRSWGEYSQFSWEMVERLAGGESSLHEEIHFYIFVQYHLHKQMVQAKESAHKCGVALKGDIPIGISRCSVEAWQYPHLFNFSQQAGAPPDFFSADGQNWGFPTYNWDEMEKDDYTWWKNRFAHFADYFDAYRIDHILGFFRIWEIPVEYRSGMKGHFSPSLPFSEDELASWGFRDADKRTLFVEDPYQKGKFHPMIGGEQSEAFALLTHGEQEAFRRLHYYYFYQRHNEFWYNSAMKKLQQLIASTNMLTCGEDLGMLNESVSRCMNNLKILSLELQIMPKDLGTGLGNPATYPYLSVCTTSTHDCETLRMWLGQRNGTGDASPQECYSTIATNMAAPSMLAILPLQDWLSIDGKLRKADASSERINIPAVADHYWRYRMHITIEELAKARELNKKIRELAAR